MDEKTPVEVNSCKADASSSVPGNAMSAVMASSCYPHAQVGLQPRFATLTLPAMYDHYPLATRLLLQSRLFKYGSKPIGFAVASDVAKCRALMKTDKKAAENMMLLRHAGWAREITWNNVKICLDLVCLNFPRCFEILVRNRSTLALPGIVYLSSIVLRGLLPAASIWAAGQLTKVVELSFEGTPAPWSSTLRVAATAVGFAILKDRSEALFKGAHSALSNFADDSIRRVYFVSRLNLLASDTQDSTYAGMVDEAGALAGQLHLRGLPEVHGDAWARLNIAGEVLSTAIQLVTQVGIVYKTVRSATTGFGMSSGTLLVIALAVGPTIIQFARNHFNNGRSWDDSDMAEWALENEMTCILDFTSKRNRQELTLFGFRDWLMGHYDTIAAKLGWHRSRQNTDMTVWKDVAVEIISHCVNNGFYVLLATHTIASHLALSDLQMHHQAAESIYSTYLQLSELVQAAFQLPFLVTATFLAEHGPVRVGPQLDYDETRPVGSSGMRIEARNLRFTYPGGKKPALRNINLTIESGECLAIVGFNGGGKTTLLKALLGINKHEGELLLNGRPYEDYSPESVHRRMSCLFQDFARYPLSVRANVGLGDTTKMLDDQAIWEALEDGGASSFIQSRGGIDRCLRSTVEEAIYKSGGWRRDYDDDESDNGDGGGESDEEGETNDQNEAAKKKQSEAEDNKQKGEHDKEKKNTEGCKVADKEGIAEETLGHESTAVDNKGIDGQEANAKAKKDDTTFYMYSPSSCAWPLGLSGGQWQRIALARAFIRAKTADLVVFDEPSAALDPSAEADLFDRIHALSHRDGHRITTIFISHRFSTVRRADKIAFVDGGEIIEYGTHDELMTLKGKYYELFTLQRNGFESMSQPTASASLEECPPSTTSESFKQATLSVVS